MRKYILKGNPNGNISAAVLDVFDDEPLTEARDIWTFPNVHITPHVACWSRPGDVADCFKVNYNQFADGLPLKHQLDWKTLY